MRPGAGAGGGVVDRRTVEVLPEVAVLEGRMREALRRSAAVGAMWTWKWWRGEQLPWGLR